MTLKNLRNSNRGFTLIELLVVIAIIGILSAVVLASLQTARQKARDATRISDMKNVQLALELYFDSGQNYPTNTNGTANAYTMGGVTLVASLVPTYIPIMPNDPQAAANSAGDYHYVGLTAAGADCSNGTAAAPTCPSYALGATLEREDNAVLDTDIDGIAYAGIYTLGATGCADTTAGGANTENCYSLRP